MNSVNEKLARLLARHPKFFWEPGMLIYQDWGREKGFQKLRIRSTEDIRIWTYVDVDMHPDLEDWATCGILLGRLTEETGHRTINIRYNDRNFQKAWVLQGDLDEPYEAWDKFGGIVAATLLFLWDEKEPVLWN